MHWPLAAGHKDSRCLASAPQCQFRTHVWAWSSFLRPWHRHPQISNIGPFFAAYRRAILHNEYCQHRMWLPENGWVLLDRIFELRHRTKAVVSLKIQMTEQSGGWRGKFICAKCIIPRTLCFARTRSRCCSSTTNNCVLFSARFKAPPHGSIRTELFQVVQAGV